MSLTRDKFLALKPRTKLVEIEDMGGNVHVRELSISEVIEFESKRAVEPTTAVCKLIVKATVDENGKRIFNDDDVEMVGGFSPAIANKIADAILAVTEVDEASAKKKQSEVAK